jgi:hypothetical protein
MVAYPSAINVFNPNIRVIRSTKSSTTKPETYTQAGNHHSLSETYCEACSAKVLSAKFETNTQMKITMNVEIGPFTSFIRRIGVRLHFGDTVTPPSPCKPRARAPREHITKAATLAVTQVRIPPNRQLVQKVASAPLDDRSVFPYCSRHSQPGCAARDLITE